MGAGSEAGVVAAGSGETEASGDGVWSGSDMVAESRRLNPRRSRGLSGVS
jgi:hypothetical protein